MHYNYGWANGFRYDIKYWEIWNELDLDDADNEPNKRNWSGTRAQFFDLFETAAKHLKGKFPELKIGGPALAWRWDWADGFLHTMSDRKVPLDFFSWHNYARNPYDVEEFMVYMRATMDKYGYTEAESICNEWNYIINWTDAYVRSIEHIISERGATFTAAVKDGKAGILLAFFDKDEYNDKEEDVQIRLEGLPIEKGEVYLTDKGHTFEKTEEFKSGELCLRLAPNSVAFIALNGLEIEKV